MHHVEMSQIRNKLKYQTLVRYLVDFCSRSPFTNFGYLARKDIHWCEFLYWILAICLMLLLGNYCGFKLVIVYTSRNSAITLKVNYMHVNTLYPAITVCPQEILDTEKVATFLSSLSYLKTDEIREQYKALLINLSNINGREAYYFNLTYFHIEAEYYMETIFNLSQVYNVTIEDQPAVKIMTEIGICYSINNYLDKEMYTKNWNDSKPFPNILRERLVFNATTFNFTDRFPSKRVIRHNITGNMSIYVHSPYELPTIWWRAAAIVNGGHTVQLTAAIREINYEDKLPIKTKVITRKCRTINESNLIMFPSTYSRNLCLMQCRASYIYRVCHCLPHFYRNRHVSSDSRSRFCDIRALKCYAQHIELFRNINDNPNSLLFKCQCYPNCIDQIVVAKVTDSVSQTNNSEIQFNILYPPTESYERSCMYSPVDYFVTLFIGLSTFLGFSILSGFDCIYFFTIRIYWYRQGYRGSVDSH